MLATSFNNLYITLANSMSEYPSFLLTLIVQQMECPDANIIPADARSAFAARAWAGSVLTAHAIIPLIIVLHISNNIIDMITLIAYRPIQYPLHS